MQYKNFEYWIDANLPINLSKTLNTLFEVKAYSIFYLNLLNNTDLEIFELAKLRKNVIIISKDEGFVNICFLKIPPPFIIWVTIGNIKNEQLFSIFKNKFIDTVNTLIKSKYPYIQLDN